MDQAPDIEGWTFYSSRQPEDISEERSIRIDEEVFEFGGLWVSPKLDLEREKIDLAAWHPLFPKVEESIKNTVLFVILDEVLGEFGTDIWLGEIETTDTELADAMPVSELRDYLHDLEIKEGWRKNDPTEIYSNYEIGEPDHRFLRSDSGGGTTLNMGLVGEYLDSEGKLEDPLEGSGAEFVFVAFDSDILTDGEQVEFRAKIEESLESILEAENSGNLLGGAIGYDLTYIDLLIFDGDRSLQLIKDELIRQELPAGTTIHFFAAENEGLRIIL